VFFERLNVCGGVLFRSSVLKRAHHTTVGLLGWAANQGAIGVSNAVTGDEAFCLIQLPACYQPRIMVEQKSMT